MSHRNEPGLPLEPGTYSTGGGEATGTAKDESVALTHAATDAAKGVGQRAQEEGGAVRDEARDQFHDLYEQTRSELADQATKQQDRVATSLQTLGGDLDTMAHNSQEEGLAKDLVT